MKHHEDRHREKKIPQPNLTPQRNTPAKALQIKTVNDKIFRGIFLAIALLCASFLLMIVGIILVKGSMPFFKSYTIGGEQYKVSLWRFITGSEWFVSPNKYGAGYIVIDTLYVVFLSLLIAAPVSVLTALFITRMAPPRIGNFLSYIIELLASIPSIIYGLFGVGVITKFTMFIARIFNYQTAGGISTLSTVIVLAVMILPTITLVSITSIRSVQESIVHGSLALGATPTQTNFRVVLASAKSGIFSGIVLGVGRALGEATAVSMVAGNAGSGPNFNLLGTTRTLTSTMLSGIHETVGLDYDIRFSVGIILIILIIITNLILNFIKKRSGNIA